MLNKLNKPLPGKYANRNKETQTRGGQPGQGRPVMAFRVQKPNFASTRCQLARSLGSTADCLGQCSLIVPQFPHLGNENPRCEVHDYFITE